MGPRVETSRAVERPTGPGPITAQDGVTASGVEGGGELDQHHVSNAVTATLRLLGAAFLSIQRDRITQQNRIAAAARYDLPTPAVLHETRAALLLQEQRLARTAKSMLRKHVLWPWLQGYPGLAGPLTARLIGIIADPWRFPGRPCARGHYVSVRYEGETCPWVDVSGGEAEGERTSEIEEVGDLCLAPLGPPRPGSGVRSLWHYLGLHAVDGRLPKRRKGVQSDWHSVGRVLCLGRDGLGDQLIRHRTPVYYDVYLETKERLHRERGVEPVGESDAGGGPALHSVAEGVERALVAESRRGPLRPIQAHKIARTVAVKRFVGDLLNEWKARTA